MTLWFLALVLVTGPVPEVVQKPESMVGQDACMFEAVKRNRQQPQEDPDRGWICLKASGNS